MPTTLQISLSTILWKTTNIQKPDNDNYPVIITFLTYTKQILAKVNKLHQSNLNLKYSADVEEDTPEID